MAGRRYPSDVSIDRYDDRREYSSRNGRRVYDDHYVDEELTYRRAPPARERERDVLVREEVRERPASPLGFLREDYGRSAAGPVVLARREREDFEYARPPRSHSRHRSPSSEPEKKVEREEIVIRHDDRDVDRRPPPPSSSRDREREEIIIRRGERDRDRLPRPAAAAPPSREVQRDEVVIRRDDPGRRSRPEVDYEKDEVVSRRGDNDQRASSRGDYDREEIVIRHSERDSDDTHYAPRRYDDYAPSRPRSRERERSRVRRAGSESDHEIIIRQHSREGRGGERQDIIIRKTSRSRSPSPSVASAPAALPEPQVIYAPTIHQEVVTHHRHVDHGFDLAVPSRPRPLSRPPSPPSPPLPPTRDEERIEIRRTGERNGRPYGEDIVINRNEGARTPLPPRDSYYDAPARPPPPPAPALAPAPIPAPTTVPYRGYDRDVQEEADYYNSRALDRTYLGEAYHGSTRDWAIVDVPPGTQRVRMDGVGGGSQEITWQRYNGVRRSKFMPDSLSDEGYATPTGRPAPLPAAANGDIGARYGREKDPREGLWTEITKDLVVKEAIQEMGYEFEETDDFYYIIAYLRYVRIPCHLPHPNGWS